MMRARHLVVGLAVLAMVAVASAPSNANWLSRIVREAGETGGGAAGKAGKLGLGALDEAAAHVAVLPKLAKGGTPLAAHVTPEGHWKFANRDGDVFTAATADELARVRTTLAPGTAADESLALYLSEDTVFARRALLKDLPQANLYVVVGKDAYRLRGGADDLAAEFRPGIVVSLGERALFEETVYRLGRPLNRADIRVLALEPGGPAHLSGAPRYDPVTKAALVDSVDPAALPAALAGMRGQTALVTGRVTGGTLTFRPSRGPEQTLDIARLVKAAEDADVNLVLLGTGSTHQPGGRNWLWQKVAVAGLDDAMKRATFADFLSALRGSEIVVTAAPGSHGRVVLSAAASPGATAPLTETLGGWIGWDKWIGEITGHVAVEAAQIYARSATDEIERDARIVPGIPSTIQYAYLGALVLGLLSIPVSLAWWARIWPPEQRSDYAGRIGYHAARVVRMIAYFLLFMPLASLPAFVWGSLLYLWGVVSAPVRAIGWLRDRLGPRRA